MGFDNMRKIKGYGVGERAVIGRLKRIAETGGESFGEIVFSKDSISAFEILSLPEEVFGIVGVLEKSVEAIDAARERGISAVFISQQDAELLSDGERAVIYPERNTLFIAPGIDIVDDFSSRIRREIKNVSDRSYRLVECRELFSGKAIMLALWMGEDMCGEEYAFSLFKEAAQGCELLKLVIIIEKIDFDSIDGLRDNIRGAIRSAVYTKIVLIVSVGSIKEYEQFLRLLKLSLKELREEGGEIPEDISCGILIKETKEAVCIEGYSSAADMVVLDIESLLVGVCEEERGRVLEGYLNVICERISGRVKDVLVIGDKTSLEKCSEKILKLGLDNKMTYFMVENKNIK